MRKLRINVQVIKAWDQKIETFCEKWHVWQVLSLLIFVWCIITAGKYLGANEWFGVGYEPIMHLIVLIFIGGISYGGFLAENEKYLGHKPKKKRGTNDEK